MLKKLAMIGGMLLAAGRAGATITGNTVVTFDLLRWGLSQASCTLYFGNAVPISCTMVIETKPAAGYTWPITGTIVATSSTRQGVQILDTNVPFTQTKQGVQVLSVNPGVVFTVSSYGAGFIQSGMDADKKVSLTVTPTAVGEGLVTANYQPAGQLYGVTGTVGANCSQTSSPWTVSQSSASNPWTVSHTGQPDIPVGIRYMFGQSSTMNSSSGTTATMYANAGYVGTWENCSNFTTVRVTVNTDKDSATNGMLVQFSDDGSTTKQVDSYSVTGNNGFAIAEIIRAAFFRIVYTNGAANQTSFTLKSTLSCSPPSSDAHQLGNMPDQYDLGTVTHALIIGQTTAAGGAYVNVKVAPSGALTADVSNSTISLTNTRMGTVDMNNPRLASVTMWIGGDLTSTKWDLPATPAGQVTSIRRITVGSSSASAIIAKDAAGTILLETVTGIGQIVLGPFDYGQVVTGAGKSLRVYCASAATVMIITVEYWQY